MKSGESKIKKAVALRYDRLKENAPRVVASGRGYKAEKILETAREAKVPVYEDPALVDALSFLDIGSEIPEQLYSIVAEVLVFVYSLDKNTRRPA